MKRACTIYGLIDPRDQQLRYIGKTSIGIARRMQAHFQRSRRVNRICKSQMWLRGLLRENINPEIWILEEVEFGDDWIEAEQFWIAYFRMIGADLCNHTDGGEGHAGLTVSDGARKNMKLAAARNKEIQSSHSRARWQAMREKIISAQNAGKGYAWKRKQSELNRVRMQSLDHPLRKSAFARRKLSDEDVAVIRCRLEHGDGPTAIAREYGVSQGHISHIKAGRDR